MRCLTDDEFKTWLASFGARLVEDNNLAFTSGSSGSHVLLARLPAGAFSINFFAKWLVSYLPTGRSRMFWLNHWMTSPPDEQILFEKLRLAYGEERPIGLAPAHSFSAGEVADGATFATEEDAALVGVILLVMLFDWRAYLLTHGSNEYVYLADQSVAFVSPSRTKLEALSERLTDLNCEVKWIKTS